MKRAFINPELDTKEKKKSSSSLWKRYMQYIEY